MSLPKPQTPLVQQDPIIQPAKGGQFLTGADTEEAEHADAWDAEGLAYRGYLGLCLPFPPSPR